MAVALHGRRVTSRILSYMQSLKTIQASAVQLQRTYSEFENNGFGEVMFNQEESATVWPDDLMGPLSPQDKRFPLPGNIGVTPLGLSKPQSVHLKAFLYTFEESVDCTLLSSFCDDSNLHISIFKVSDVSGVLQGLGRSDREIGLVSQLISESDCIEEVRGGEATENITDTLMNKYFENSCVEVAAQDCPKVLRKDFSLTFAEMPKKNITVLTIAQKAMNDMSSWNERVEEERETLLDNFIATAKEICHVLRANNFWCDFIDPSSGLPYFGQYTNATMFETDERYNNLGFEIEDLGCCKVITHKKWGSKVFVGTILTSAAKDHEIIVKLMSCTR